MAETLSHKKAQRFYGGFSCAHCKVVADYVALAQHVNVVYVFIPPVKLEFVLNYSFSHTKLEPTNQDIIPILDYISFETEYWLWPPRPVAGIPNLTII
jgi:phosphoribulokinase